MSQTVVSSPTAASPMPSLPVKRNTRITDPVDITDIDHVLVRRSLDLIAQLRYRTISVDRFQAAIELMHAELDLPNVLQPWIARTLETRQDQTLYRRSVPEGRETIQLFYLEPREVHPPHGHHNIISTQVVLHGRVHLREYDRITRLTEDTVLLKLKTDGWAGVGGIMRTTEVSGNVHWFAADDHPAVMLNFNIYGYQDWTLDKGPLPFRRKLIDPTFGRNLDGWIIGKEIELDEAYDKFGGHPLETFRV